jgi:hypothetical protein
VKLKKSSFITNLYFKGISLGLKYYSNIEIIKYSINLILKKEVKMYKPIIDKSSSVFDSSSKLETAVLNSPKKSSIDKNYSGDKLASEIQNYLSKTAINTDAYLAEEGE